VELRRRYLVLGLSAVLAIALAVPALGGPSNPVAEISASAKKTAKKALKKAKQAQQTADQAQGDANSAQNSANDAQGSASNAQTTADQAAAAAAAAQTSADAAQATADSKFGDVIERFGSPSPTNSTDSKQASVACTGTEDATGGGYSTAGAGSNDVTAQVNFGYGSDGWIVQMEEIGAGTGDTWSVTAAVQCAQTE
jgi:hypothetical protein